MRSSLHLVILFLAFGCKAEVSLTTDNAVVTEIRNTSETPGNLQSFFEKNSTNFLYITVPKLIGKDVTSKPTTKFPYNATQQTTIKQTKHIKSNSTVKSQKPIGTSNATCTGEEKYKSGIIICVIIIAILVFIIAMFIVCIVALANKVSSLKKRLTQSKRQARSNGDFLSASSILWPSGMETWQKKANLTMDEISLGDAHTIGSEKHILMVSETLEKAKEATEENTNSLSTTIHLSTVEV